MVINAAAPQGVPNALQVYRSLVVDEESGEAGHANLDVPKSQHEPTRVGSRARVLGCRETPLLSVEEVRAPWG